MCSVQELRQNNVTRLVMLARRYATIGSLLVLMAIAYAFCEIKVTQSMPIITVVVQFLVQSLLIALIFHVMEFSTRALRTAARRPTGLSRGSSMHGSFRNK